MEDNQLTGAIWMRSLLNLVVNNESRLLGVMHTECLVELMLTNKSRPGMEGAADICRTETGYQIEKGKGHSIIRGWPCQFSLVAPSFR
jgi:hypothetical protein